MLCVIFDCRKRIYSNDEVVGHGQIYETQAILKNWQEVIDFINRQYLNDVDCEVLDIRPMECNLCEEETEEESELQEEEETAAASCSDVEEGTSQVK